MIHLTEDQFDEQFTVKPNHITGNEAFGGLYETYDEELEYTFQLSQKSNRVWTILDGDDDKTYIASGFHRINRVGFLITEEEYEEEYEVELDF